MFDDYSYSRNPFTLMRELEELRQKADGLSAINSNLRDKVDYLEKELSQERDENKILRENNTSLKNILEKEDFPLDKIVTYQNFIDDKALLEEKLDCIESIFPLSFLKEEYKEIKKFFEINKNNFKEEIYTYSDKSGDIVLIFSNSISFIISDYEILRESIVKKRFLFFTWNKKKHYYEILKKVTYNWTDSGNKLTDKEKIKLLDRAIEIFSILFK